MNLKAAVRGRADRRVRWDDFVSMADAGCDGRESMSDASFKPFSTNKRARRDKRQSCACEVTSWYFRGPRTIVWPVMVQLRMRSVVLPAIPVSIGESRDRRGIAKESQVEAPSSGATSYIERPRFGQGNTFRHDARKKRKALGSCSPIKRVRYSLLMT